MKRKLIISGFIALLLVYLYMEGRTEQLRQEIIKLKTLNKITESELSFALPLLTKEDLRKVKNKFDSNQAFLKQVFPDSFA